MKAFNSMNNADLDEMAVKVDYLNSTPHLQSRKAADVEPEKVEWLWAGRLARGKQTCVAGEPGTGKSQLSVFITAKITTGGEWPCGEGRAPRFLYSKRTLLL